MIGWEVALVLVVFLILVSLLIEQYMSQKHEYRMERLKQDHEIVNRPGDGDE